MRANLFLLARRAAAFVYGSNGLTQMTSPPNSIWHRLLPKRDLLWQFTRRAIEMRHRGSYLGFLWSVLNPLLMGALYVIVFGVIFNGRFHAVPGETAIDFALGVFLGLVFFHVLAETAAAAPTFIVASPNLVKKVVFPLEIIPVAQVGAFWFHALISLTLFFFGAIFIGRGVTLEGLLWLPALILPHLLLTLGLALLLSALGVFFRDINQVIPVVTQILLYASAVFFPVTRIKESAFAWSILKWNPLLQTVDLARDILLWQNPMSLHRLLYLWLVGAACFLVGAWVFRMTKRSFAEAI